MTLRADYSLLRTIISKLTIDSDALYIFPVSGSEALTWISMHYMDHLLCQNTYLHPVCLAMTLCEVLHLFVVSLSMLVKFLVYQLCFSVTFLEVGVRVHQLRFL